MASVGATEPRREVTVQSAGGDVTAWLQRLRYTWKKSTLWSLYMLAPRCRGCKFDAEIQVRAKMIDVKFQVQVTVILSVSCRSLERGGVSEPSQATGDR